MSDLRRREAELRELRPKAELELKRYPGVVAVGVGFRERGGEITDELTFLAYVLEKKDAAVLGPGELLPREYEGVPVDVIQVPQSTSASCEDHQQHSQLVGGITISTLKADGNGKVGIGTLGFFATIGTSTDPHDIVLVTNNHVVMEPPSSRGDTVYQPEWIEQGGVWKTILDRGEPIGSVHVVAPKKDDQQGFFVDAASVKLDICISSWCNTNCGVSFGNQQLGLALGGKDPDALRDVGEAHVGDPVIKVGRTTGRTTGTVVKIDLPLTKPGNLLVHNNIEILAGRMSTPDNCGGVLRFSDEGDSGAALVDAAQGKLLGLVHGHNPNDRARSHACHIAPVVRALGITPITKAHPVHGNPAAVGMAASLQARVDGRPNLTPELRAKFYGSAEGRRIAAVVDRHRLEVVHLVNHNRRVTVAWHRNKGPAFLNRAIENARDPEVEIPREIEGVGREQLLLAMERVLAEHGSSGLARAMERHRDEVLAAVASFDSLHELVDSLERTAA